MYWKVWGSKLPKVVIEADKLDDAMAIARERNEHYDIAQPVDNVVYITLFDLADDGWHIIEVPRNELKAYNDHTVDWWRNGMFVNMYDIVQCFDDRHRAEQYINKECADHCDITEFEK